MTLKSRIFAIAGAGVGLWLALSSAANAATIIKLNLGGVGPDLSMTAGGVLGTVSDGNAATTGDQNTNVEYTSFLDPLADINASTASFSLAGLQTNGFAQVLPNLIVQDFTGGTLNLYDSSNTLLLSGNLATSTLVGNSSPQAAGTIFSTSFGTITGGVLQPFILPNTLAVTMNLTNVNGGVGLTVGAAAPILQEFTADASVNIVGEPDPNGNIPEPASAILVLTAVTGLFATRRRG